MEISTLDTLELYHLSSDGVVQVVSRIWNECNQGFADLATKILVHEWLIVERIFIFDKTTVWYVHHSSSCG